MKQPSIETKDLILRPFVWSDWKFVHEYASDPQVVRYMPYGPNTIAQSKAYTRLVMKPSRAKVVKDFRFIIYSKIEGRPVGGCRLNTKGLHHQDAGMGYVIIRKYWRRGYATEAAKTMIKFGFTKLKLHRIWATCDVRNKVSARVLERVGMKREGLLRQNVFQKGRWRDSYLYAILEPKTRRRH